jgi:uncharacterized protein (TIGR02246 family)
MTIWWRTERLRTNGEDRPLRFTRTALRRATVRGGAFAVGLLGSMLFLNPNALAQTASSDVPTADRAAIDQTAMAFVNAWNAHDAHAFALTFVSDADFTNVLGVHAAGRPAIETVHAQVFAKIFKATHQTLQVRSVRLLTPAIAAVDIDWRMTGAVNPDGSARPELRGLLNWVMQRQSDGSWLIIVMHNTPLAGYPAN